MQGAAILLLKALAGCVALVVLLCFSNQLTDAHDERNPATNPADSVWADSRVPEPVRKLLARSCADCHSNQVHWPYLSRLPLVSRVFESDVYRARGLMNLSEWASLRRGNQEDFQGLLNGICEETRISYMPPRRYVVLHPKTAVSAQESEDLCRWAGSHN